MNNFLQGILKAKKTRRTIGEIIDQYTSGKVAYSEKNFLHLVRAYTQWVYSCAHKNALAVSTQNLRLFVVNRRNRVVPTKAITPETKDYLYQNYYDDIRKASLGNRKIEIEEVLMHPFLDLINKPNDFYTKMSFFYLAQLFDELTGNDYWVMSEITKTGIPRELWVLYSQYVKIVPDSAKFIKEYEYDNGGGKKQFIKPDYIIHNKFPSPSDLFYGVSPLSQNMASVNLQNSINTYQQAVFDNMGILAGYFTTKNNISDAQWKRLNTRLKRFRGKDKAGHSPLLDNGLEYHPRAINPKDILNAVLGQKSREEIAAGFGVPMTLLTETSSNRSTADAANYQYMRDTIHPRLIMRSEIMNAKIVKLYDQKLFCAFDNPVKEDNEEVRKKHETYMKWGVMTANEVRRQVGLEPLSGGDIRIVPANYMPADFLAEFWGNQSAPIDTSDGQGGENTERSIQNREDIDKLTRRLIEVENEKQFKIE